MRTLAIDYTHDSKVYDTQFHNQYFFGRAFLVAPSESNKGFAKVYFPKGKFYDLYTDAVEMGNQEKIIPLTTKQLPVYVKESSIIPMQSLIQNTSEKPTDTLVVHVYKGDVNNSFVYYEDDGESYNYENGVFHKRTISYDAVAKTILFGKVEGSFKSKFNNLKLVFHGFNNISSFNKSGKSIIVKDDFVSFINPISKFDPQGTANPIEGVNVKSVVVKNDKDSFTISY